MFSLCYSALLTYVFLHYSCAWIVQEPALYQVTPPIDHGEGPSWDSRTGLLYYLNAYDGQILSYNPKTSKVNAVTIGSIVSYIVPTKYNPHQFIVARNRSLLAVEWDGKTQLGSVKQLNEVSPQFPTSRFNDGRVDRNGNLWIGTMGLETPTGVVPDQGILYFVNKTNIANPQPEIQPVSISNALTWNKANTKLYYMDTLSFKIVAYDYDNQTEEISNPKVVLDLTQNPQTNGTYPDGLTIDKDDKLWVGLNLGGSVIRVDPETGDILQRVAVPASTVTGVNWGGYNMDILYVTTSRHLLTDSDKIMQPAAGSVFGITGLGTHGLPNNYANIL